MSRAWTSAVSRSCSTWLRFPSRQQAGSSPRASRRSRARGAGAPAPARADRAPSMPETNASARLALLQVGDFAPCVGQVFRLAHDGGSLELLLQRADPAGARAPRAGRVAFSLGFLGPEA